MDKLKQTKNLFKKFIENEKSMFYATDTITRTFLNKDRKSLYEKDKVFYKYYLDLDDKNVLFENKKYEDKNSFLHSLC